MAVLGREAASQAMTSADIVDGAFTLNDLNFTDVPTNLDITGTIDKNTMRLAEGVTVIGDVTISDDLVLAKLSDDGVGITMTTDGTTRTITGSGSIESTTIAQTHSPSVTGMTGELGSAVTQASGYTLGSEVIFPAGHVLKIERVEQNYNKDVTGTTYDEIESSSGIIWEPSIDMTYSTSKLWVIFNLSLSGIRSGSNNGRGAIKIEQDIAGAGYSEIFEAIESFGTYDYGGSGIWAGAYMTLNFLQSVSNAGIIKYKMWIKSMDGSGIARSNGDGRVSNVTFIEVAG